MKKSTIFCAALAAALSFNAAAQPPQQTEVVSKADRTTVEFVVRDSKPILMDKLINSLDVQITAVEKAREARQK